jgi:hypothetical protein
MSPYLYLKSPSFLSLPKLFSQLVIVGEYPDDESEDETETDKTKVTVDNKGKVAAATQNRTADEETHEKDEEGKEEEEDDKNDKNEKDGQDKDEDEEEEEGDTTETSADEVRNHKRKLTEEGYALCMH